MKALSIKQPWGWLIVNGYKDIENRDWPTHHRGGMLIHVGRKIDKDATEWIKDKFPDIPLPESFETGGIIGRCKLVDCVGDHESPWFVGKFGFVLVEQESFDKMIPCKGTLGFFRPDYNSRYVDRQA